MSNVFVKMYMFSDAAINRVEASLAGLEGDALEKFVGGSYKIDLDIEVNTETGEITGFNLPHSFSRKLGDG